MKKILALCLALTMALAVFAGCSGAASSSAPAAGSASGSASTGGSATGKQLSGKVVYWSMYNEGEPEAMAIQKAADMFMEDYPDCEVEIQWIGRSNQDITGPALEGGEQLDILDNFSYDKSTDRYLDITDMMNEPALGQEDMTVAESILPVLNLANAQGQEKAGLETDKYYGVQMFPWVVGFFYNKDLFQQAGITETPETWTEFMEACQKLKDAGINAVTCDDAYMTLIPNNYLARLVGSDTIAAMSASASDPAWQSEEVKQAFAAMEALSPFMSPQTATNKYPAGQQEFALGEAAMYLNASWMPSEVADTAGEDFPWGFFAFPQVEDGAEGSGYVSVGGVPLAVYSGSPNPEAAFMDGATEGKIFFRITLPLIADNVKTQFTFWTIGCIGFFLWSRVFSVVPSDPTTITPASYMYDQIFGTSISSNAVASGTNVGMGAAIGVVLCLITVAAMALINLIFPKEKYEM